jgi:hypothetical protein
MRDVNEDTFWIVYSYIMDTYQVEKNVLQHKQKNFMLIISLFVMFYRQDTQIECIGIYAERFYIIAGLSTAERVYCNDVVRSTAKSPTIKKSYIYFINSFACYYARLFVVHDFYCQYYSVFQKPNRHLPYYSFKCSPIKNVFNEFRMSWWICMI